MQFNQNTDNTSPRQKLPRSSKDKEWCMQNVDYIIKLSSFANNGAGNSTFNKKVNYDLYNGIINEEDFEYVTNPYNSQNGKFPARLQNYNIITPKLKVLEGEEIKRPFNFRVAAVNADAVSQIEEKKKNLLLQYFEGELIKDLQIQGVPIQNPGEAPMTPPEIEKYMTYSDADIRESVANQLANYLIKKENLEYKFNKGWKDSLICSEEFYYTGIDKSDPVCEVVNPLDFDFDRNPDLDFVQDGSWACHIKYMTVSQIIDQFHDDLTDEEIDALEGSNNSTYGQLEESGWEDPGILTKAPSFDGGSNDGLIPVARVEWKSMRKIGFLKYYDEELKEQQIIVDETYKPIKYKGEEVEWVWIEEVWEGNKLGRHFYKRMRPKSVQYRTMDNPSTCKLGYVGATYNNRNSTPTSPIDTVKHHQYLYNIIMYRLELELAKAKGKKMVMDIAQIPRSQGIDIDKWMYYFDTVGIAFINSFEEGKGKLGQGMVSTFNQFTQVDMSLSQSVGQYITILQNIEDMVGNLMGVNRQREGSISSTETVGGVERAVSQSSHITEPLFYIHNEIKKNVLTQLIECAKVAYPSGKKISYITGDLARVLLTVDENFINADYGVFVTNSSREIKALDDLKQLAQQAVASGMITLSELVSIIDSTSIADVKNTVKNGEIKMQKQKEQEHQQQLELQQQESEALRKLESDKQDRLDNREIIKGEIQKEVQEIANSKQYNDEDDDGKADVLEIAKLDLQALEHRDNMSLERDKMAQDKDLAEKKIAVDAIKARLKPKTSKS